MTFNRRVREVQKSRNSLLCIGVDVDARHLPRILRRSANPPFEFARRIIEATTEFVCALKFNLAFYEADGFRGLKNLEKLLSLTPRGILTIGDGKRGDIGNSSKMYARAMFGGFGFDAVTVNPYMGYDSIEPFIEDERRGAFVLVMTSNPGSRDFQRLNVAGKPMYERVAATARRWNSRHNVGVVAGATHAGELRRIRKILPDVPILIPGVGAQGGSLSSAVRHGCTRQRDLAVVNVGRSVLYASSRSDFLERAREEAERIQITMNRLRTA